MGAEAAHLHELAEVIGPRPATTDTEARAADYIEGVFRGRALNVERQEFDCPRTYSWTYAVYHLLTIAAALAARPEWGAAVWPALAVSAITALLMWRDLDTRRALSSIMPKGPSQNIIARHVPKARRGERVVRVVVVAHYDSARASLGFAPSMVKNFATTFGLMKWCTFLVPVLVLAAVLPPAETAQPWLWYVTLGVAAYLVLPLVFHVHRELLMSATDGANDNASGVAAMLGVMDRVIPEPEALPISSTQPIMRTVEEAEEADVVPKGAVLTYSPAETPTRPFAEDFSTDEFTWGDLSMPAGQGRLELGEDADESGAGEAGRGTREEGGRPRRESVRDWLGIESAFDARAEGRRIGSWDNFDEDAEDDDVGLKGGSAEPGPDDQEFAAFEAARIRRKVTGGVDRALLDKEIWFVATGAEEAGTWGMLAFLSEYAEQLRGALIVNIDNVGAGNLHWVSREGMARRYPCDRRLATAARRAAAERGMTVRSREYTGLSTDATPALARGYRAMSVMAFDINGRLPNWHWSTDTIENIEEDVVVSAADFVTEIIRAL